jgi:hypothetical protein
VASVFLTALPWLGFAFGFWRLVARIGVHEPTTTFVVDADAPKAAPVEAIVEDAAVEEHERRMSAIRAAKAGVWPGPHAERRQERCVRINLRWRVTAMANRDRPIRTTRLSSFGISRWSPYSIRNAQPLSCWSHECRVGLLQLGRRSMLRVRTRQLMRPLSVCAAVPDRMYDRQLQAITRRSVGGAIPSRVNLDHPMLIERTRARTHLRPVGTTLVACPGAHGARVVGGFGRATTAGGGSFFGPNRPGRQRWTELMEQPRRAVVTRQQSVLAQIALTISVSNRRRLVRGFSSHRVVS